MKNFTILLMLLLAVACNNKNQVKLEEFQVNKYLDENAQSEFIQKIIYKAGKWPKSATAKTVKHAHFAEDFEGEARMHTLKYYYPVGDTIYFAYWKIAPSIKEKYRMTAGKLVMGEDEPIFYQELFRTWKFEPAIMEQKGAILFAKLLNGEDLTPYYIENSGEEEWIEFPDSETWWDMESEKWKSTRTLVLDTLYQIKQTKMEEILSKQDSTN